MLPKKKRKLVCKIKIVNDEVMIYKLSGLLVISWITIVALKQYIMSM